MLTASMGSVGAGFTGASQVSQQSLEGGPALCGLAVSQGE